MQPSTAPTAGQQCWVDAVQLDEGASVRTFTTTTAPITYRFDGYVDEWPVEWPNGGKEESLSAIRANDLQSRIARSRVLRSVIEETYDVQSPARALPPQRGGGRDVRG